MLPLDYIPESVLGHIVHLSSFAITHEFMRVNVWCGHHSAVWLKHWKIILGWGTVRTVVSIGKRQRGQEWGRGQGQMMLTDTGSVSDDYFDENNMLSLFNYRSIYFIFSLISFC